MFIKPPFKTYVDPNTAYDVQMSANTKAGASALSRVISAPVPSDIGGLSIVVIVVALVVVLAHILIIILLVLLVLKMRWTVKTRNTELVELQTHNIDDQSGIYEVIDKEWKEEAFSEIKSPSNTYAVISQSKSKVEGLTMTQCPAYAPVTSLTVNCWR